MYQVVRLDVLGDQQFLYTGQPDPYVGSNPAQLYPVNTLNFWWADVMHPLFRLRVRLLLLALLLALGAAAGAGLIRSVASSEDGVLAPPVGDSGVAPVRQVEGVQTQ